MSKIVKTGTEAQPVYTETATTLTDTLVTGLMAPINAIAGPDDEFITVKDAAIGAVAWGIGGVFIGDRYGDSIPVLGGGRK